MASAHIMTLLPVNTWRSGLAKLANAQAHTLGTDTPVPEDEENREDGLGQEIEDTVEYSLTVWSNDISTFADTPSHWVK